MSISNVTDQTAPFPKSESAIPPLVDGERLDQKTFHERYLAMPKNVRAELVGGIVFMASPAKRRHTRTAALLTSLLIEYEEATPGVEADADTTLILGPTGEPEPDCLLLVTPDKGGGSRTNDEGYLEGVPELIIEVSSTSESRDLNWKKEEYERAGVREYLVVALRQARFIWFVLRNGKYEEISLDADGVLRSPAFPGLWIDSSAVLRKDLRRMKEVLRQGLASPEHAAWVKELAAR